MAARARPAPDLAAEHAWHDCTLPPPPDDPTTTWHCPRCHQTWHWRRPPRPPAQWTRAATED